MASEPTQTPRRMPTADVVLAVIAAHLAAGVALWRALLAPHFARMYEDFGATDGLPRLTRLAFAGPTPVVLIALTLAPVLLAARRATRAAPRRWLMVAAVVLGLGANAALWAGTYAPVFAIAGNVR